MSATPSDSGVTPGTILIHPLGPYPVEDLQMRGLKDSIPDKLPLFVPTSLEE